MNNPTPSLDWLDEILDKLVFAANPHSGGPARSFKEAKQAITYRMKLEIQKAYDEGFKAGGDYAIKLMKLELTGNTAVTAPTMTDAQMVEAVNKKLSGESL